MKLSKAKTKEINSISFAAELLKQFNPTLVKNSAGIYVDSDEAHWTNSPPDTWTDSEREIWDLMFGLEDKLKESILKILT